MKLFIKQLWACFALFRLRGNYRWLIFYERQAEADAMVRMCCAGVIKETPWVHVAHAEFQFFRFINGEIGPFDLMNWFYVREAALVGRK